MANDSSPNSPQSDPPQSDPPQSDSPQSDPPATDKSLSDSEVSVDPPPPVDDGPGWLPAIMAGTVLMGILGFLFCGFSTWVLFQRRTELATRTIRDAYLPELQQSYLDPDTKRDVVAVISQLATDLENGKYENWQSAGILQRLQRIPVLQWGRLTAVKAFYEPKLADDPDRLATINRQMRRLQQGIQTDRLTSFDLQDVLEPVLEPDPKSPSAYSLIQPMTIKSAEQVFDRVRLWLEDSKIPDEDFDEVSLAKVLQNAIETGAAQGTM